MPTEVAPHLGGYIPGGDDATFFPDMWRWLVEHLGIKNVLDIGCGEGHALKFFQTLGVPATGIDGVAQDNPHIFQHDFTERSYGWDHALHPRTQYNLIWMCEFVEHLEERFLPNLVPLLYHGSYVAMTHAFPGQLGHHHVNCVIEGTSVSHGIVEAAFRRRYVGKVVTLVTTDGDKLTITPNHPIATTRGWIAAGLLHEGDDLVGSSFRNRKPGSVMPDTYQGPSPVEQVFRSVEEMSPAGVRPVPASAEQFHGDGTDGEVDIVRTNSQLLLESDTSIGEQLREQTFSGRSMSTALLSRERTQRFLSIGNEPTSRCSVQSLHSFGAFFGSHLLPSIKGIDGRATSGDSLFPKNPQDDVATHLELSRKHRTRQSAQVAVHDSLLVDRATQGLSPSTDSDTSFDKGSTRVSIVDVSLLSQASKRFPGLVATKKLASVRLSDFVGHVYNLTTEDGFYEANGLMVHNCRDPEYWLGFMAAIGFKYERGLTQQARAVAAFNEHKYNHFVRSGLVFSHR